MSEDKRDWKILCYKCGQLKPFEGAEKFHMGEFWGWRCSDCKNIMPKTIGEILHEIEGDNDPNW